MCRPLHFSYSCGHPRYSLWQCLHAFIEEGDVNAMCPAGKNTAGWTIRRFNGCEACEKNDDAEIIEAATTLLNMRNARAERPIESVEALPSIVVQRPPVETSPDSDATLVQTSREMSVITIETTPEPDAMDIEATMPECLGVY